MSLERVQIIPQIEFSNISNLKPEEVEAIKQKGAVLIKDVVDDQQAAAWREELKEYVSTNPVEGE